MRLHSLLLFLFFTLGASAQVVTAQSAVKQSDKAKQLATAKVLLLWVKIATKDVTVTEEEVKQYLAKHPTVHHLPARTQLSLSQCQLPTEYKTVSRGLPQTEVFSPTLSVTSRGPIV